MITNSEVEEVLALHTHQNQVVSLFLGLLSSCNERYQTRFRYEVRALDEPHLGIYQKSRNQQVARVREDGDEDYQVIWVRSVQDLTAIERAIKSLEKELTDNAE